MIRGIHHPGIATGDLDRALTFYRDLLGFEEVSSFGWQAGTEMGDVAGEITGLAGSTARQCMLKAGNAFLEIFEFSEPPSKRLDDRSLSNHGFSHICLDVDDVDAEYDRLEKAGIIFQSPPTDVGPMRIAYCRDPDGNFVELQQITEAGTPIELKF